VRGPSDAGASPPIRHIDTVDPLLNGTRVACAALAAAFSLLSAGMAVAPPGSTPARTQLAASDSGPIPTTLVPRGVPTPGLTAGTGAVRVHEYVDLGDLGDARAHQRVVPTLLQQVAAEGLGTIVLRPLVLGRDANSVEVAGALIAAARQDRAWFVAAHLVTARTEGAGAGDWITPATLRALGRAVTGLAVARFVHDATGRSVYPKLNTIRREAQAANVTVTPAFVVKGPRGTRLVSDPARASEVLGAIGEVR
jgi:protein-disulfide isomerase